MSLRQEIRNQLFELKDQFARNVAQDREMFKAVKDGGVRKDVEIVARFGLALVLGAGAVGVVDHLTDNHVLAAAHADISRVTGTNGETCPEPLPGAMIYPDASGKPVTKYGVGYSIGELAAWEFPYRHRTSKDMDPHVIHIDGCPPVEDGFVFPGFHQAPNALFYMNYPVSSDKGK